MLKVELTVLKLIVEQYPLLSATLGPVALLVPVLVLVGLWQARKGRRNG